MNIEFNDLLTITNMPIKRFADDLLKFGEYAKYMELLVNNFNKNTVKGLMCRNLISISWDGTMYDCDFNQALEMKVPSEKTTIWDVKTLDELLGQRIATDKHCFGCTAGTGSSCSGALA